MLDSTKRLRNRNRLNDSADYQRVFKTKCRLANDVTLVLASRNRLGYARLGMAVSRKNIKTAADRNTVKRIIRESFRLNQERLAGWDIVVLMRRPLNNINKNVITRSLTGHWQRLQSCKESSQD